MGDLLERFEESLGRRSMLPLQPGVAPWLIAEDMIRAWFSWYGQAVTRCPRAITPEEHRLADEHVRLTTLRYRLHMAGNLHQCTSQYEAGLLAKVIKPDWKAYVLTLCEAVHAAHEDEEERGHLWACVKITDRHVMIEGATLEEVNA